MKLYCRVYSSGKLEELYQPPIIFLHGIALSGNTFKKVAPMIAERTTRKVYVPDMRNHGKSPWLKEMSYDVLVNDILQFMEENKIPKAILVGNSMGGRIAMKTALKYPHKVDALVVEDMTPRNIVSRGINIVTSVMNIAQNILDSYTPDMDIIKVKMDLTESVLSFFPHRVNKEKLMKNYDPDFVPIIKEGDKFRFECNLDVITEMLDNDALVENLTDLKITFNGDALFLYGSKGFFNLDNDPSVRKLFPKAVIIKVQDASHCIHVDSPEEYTNILVDFILKRNPTQSRY